MAEVEEAQANTRKPLPIGRVLFGLVAIVALVALGRTFGVFLDRFVEWVDGLGPLGPIVFILGYIGSTVAFIPGSVLTLAAGAIFGLGEGVLYVMTGATLGSSVAFLLARYVAREAVEQRIAGNAKFAAVDRAVGREGWKIVVLLRLSPVFPYNLLNYGLGLTKVRFRDYVLASIGMLPGSFLYTYSGFLVGDVIRLAGDAGPERGPLYYAVVVVGLLATIAVTAVVTKTARQAITEATGTA
ncbi:MAG: TVP38/TMEM64 family protein [Acidobacteria bacterium]|nr:TVP38/TMEM64 family protein [Acidobacteriota bacterium]